MDESTVRQRLLVACEAVLHNDRQLLELNVGERSIAAKLHQYLAGVFPSHHVDCEYNRHGVDPKRVAWSKQCALPDEPLVLPDIVVHRRGDDSANLVVCEVKKDSTSSDWIECDRQKLREIKQRFSYEHAALIIVPTGPRASTGHIIVEGVS